MSSFLFFGCICGIWKFLAEGLTPSHSCNLHHSCRNTATVTKCTRPGMEPTMSETSWIINSLYNCGNSLFFVILFTVYLDVVLFGFFLLRTLCFLDLISVSFSRLGTSSASLPLNIFLCQFLFFFSFWEPYKANGRMLDTAKRSLKLSSFILILFPLLH